MTEQDVADIRLIVNEISTLCWIVSTWSNLAPEADESIIAVVAGNAVSEACLRLWPEMPATPLMIGGTR